MTLRDSSVDMPVKRYVVTGTVQGVGYRYFTRSVAISLGIRGFVQNLPDGSVEVQAAGDAVSLEAFSTALARGPSAARVAGVVETEPVQGGSYPSFIIRG